MGNVLSHFGRYRFDSRRRKPDFSNQLVRPRARCIHTFRGLDPIKISNPDALSKYYCYCLGDHKKKTKKKKTEKKKLENKPKTLLNNNNNNNM